MGLVRIGKVVRALGLKGHLGVAGTEGALARLERVALRTGLDVAARRQGRRAVLDIVD